VVHAVYGGREISCSGVDRSAFGGLGGGGAGARALVGSGGDGGGTRSAAARPASSAGDGMGDGRVSDPSGRADGGGFTFGGRSAISGAEHPMASAKMGWRVRNTGGTIPGDKMGVPDPLPDQGSLPALVGEEDTAPGIGASQCTEGRQQDTPIAMLVPGSQIAVVAPGHPFFPERLEAGLAVLRSWGLEPVMMPNLTARYRYTAGTRRQRRDDLLQALTDPAYQGVWYARGGSGTVHLMDALPVDRLDTRPIFGFSDATTLLSTLWNRRAGMPVHAPVLHTLGSSSSADTVDAMRRMVFEGPNERFWPGVAIAGAELVAEGPVVGGNLCVLASLCGTPHQLDASGCILLLEEVGEVAYKVDRLVTQLRAAGAFKGVLGVALGEFTGTRIPDDSGWSIDDVVVECLEGLDIPIVTGLPVGHGARNLPFVIGEPGQLSAHGLLLSGA